MRIKIHEVVKAGKTIGAPLKEKEENKEPEVTKEDVLNYIKDEKSSDTGNEENLRKKIQAVLDSDQSDDGTSLRDRLLKVVNDKDVEESARKQQILNEFKNLRS